MTKSGDGELRPARPTSGAAAPAGGPACAACSEAAAEAYESARLDGLCEEGAREAATGARCTLHKDAGPGSRGVT